MNEWKKNTIELKSNKKRTNNNHTHTWKRVTRTVGPRGRGKKINYFIFKWKMHDLTNIFFFFYFHLLFVLVHENANYLKWVWKKYGHWNRMKMEERGRESKCNMKYEMNNKKWTLLFIMHGGNNDAKSNLWLKMRILKMKRAKNNLFSYKMTHTHSHSHTLTRNG